MRTRLDLVYGEFLVREQMGETAPPEEYVARFPEFEPRFAGNSSCTAHLLRPKTATRLTRRPRQKKDRILRPDGTRTR